MWIFTYYNNNIYSIYNELPSLVLPEALVGEAAQVCLLLLLLSYLSLNTIFQILSNC